MQTTRKIKLRIGQADRSRTLTNLPTCCVGTANTGALHNPLHAVVERGNASRRLAPPSCKGNYYFQSSGSILPNFSSHIHKNGPFEFSYIEKPGSA